MNLKITVSERVAGNEPFRKFLASLPQTFNDQGTVIHAARNCLRIMDVGALDVEGLDRVMVKRYHGLNLFQKIVYTYFRRSKCRKAFDNTAELRRRGFAAAEELAMVEVWKHGLYQYAFFVSAVATGERLDSLVIRLQEQGGMKDAIDLLITQYASLVRRLHEHGVLYRDMNCGNVLCRQDEPGGAWAFTLVDTNRARLYPPDTQLDLDTVKGDLILMNPKMGTVEQFIAEYLRQRGLYTEERAAAVRQLQHDRYERKRPVKTFFKRYKKAYYQWVGR